MLDETVVTVVRVVTVVTIVVTTRKVTLMTVFEGVFQYENITAYVLFVFFYFIWFRKFALML